MTTPRSIGILLALLFAQSACAQGRNSESADFKPLRELGVTLEEGTDSLAVTRDGKRIVVGSNNPTAYDAVTGKALASYTFSPPSFSEVKVAVSPDGNLVAVGTQAGKVHLLQATTLRAIPSLGETAMQHPRNTRVSQLRGITDLKFSPDSTRLATADYDGTVIVWDVAAQKSVLTFSDHAASVLALAYAPDGGSIASGDRYGIVKIWSAATGATQATLQGDHANVKALDYHPSGKWLASGSYSSIVRLWDVATGKPVQEFKERIRVESVVFRPDGKQLAVGGPTGVAIWDAVNGTKLGEMGPLQAKAPLAYSPDGKFLVTRQATQRRTPVDALNPARYTLRLWNTETEDPSPDKNSPRTAGEKPQKVSTQDPKVQGRRMLKHLRSTNLWAVSSAEPFGVVAFSPNGKAIATLGDQVGSVAVYDVASLQRRRTIAGGLKPLEALFSPDGSRIAAIASTASRRGGGSVAPVSIVQMETGSGDRSTLVTLEKNVTVRALSPDWKTVATHEMRSPLTLWDTATGERRVTIQPPIDPAEAERLERVLPRERANLMLNPILKVAFSSDSATVATATNDKSIRLWNATNGKELREFTGHTGVVSQLRFSPDGQWLASYGADHRLKLWNLHTGSLQHNFDIGARAITCMAFSPDSKTLATGSFPNSAGESSSELQLWDVVGNTELTAVPNGNDRTASLVFSPDGKLLATLHQGVVKLWTLSDAARR